MGGGGLRPPLTTGAGEGKPGDDANQGFVVSERVLGAGDALARQINGQDTYCSIFRGIGIVSDRVPLSPPYLPVNSQRAKMRRAI